MEVAVAGQHAQGRLWGTAQMTSWKMTFIVPARGLNASQQYTREKGRAAALIGCLGDFIEGTDLC